ncbi:hypothetical protein AOQ84DRAFT_359331 [Glonium stellatum]|uniref:DUF6594 domain-containing protein n=1 Tax=Glonium stellatum TaxID=574774 RepID=A0A8E2FBL8_9PEZI|nr:hypothetical protein AOQ84DRAFT_359331 [Glonium stellatum]
MGDGLDYNSVGCLKRPFKTGIVASGGDTTGDFRERQIEINQLHFSPIFTRVWRCRVLSLRKLFNISRDPNVHISTSPVLRKAAYGIIALLAMILLLLPIVICNATTNAPARMSIVAVAAIFFVVTLCGLTRAKSIEIFVAGATYTTVLVVFVSGVSSGNT